MSLLGLREAEIFSYYLIGVEFKFCKMKTFLELKIDDGYKTIRMYFVLLICDKLHIMYILSQ
jgi:hypothetical protein